MATHKFLLFYFPFRGDNFGESTQIPCRPEERCKFAVQAAEILLPFYKASRCPAVIKRQSRVPHSSPGATETARDARTKLHIRGVLLKKQTSRKPETNLSINTHAITATLEKEVAEGDKEQEKQRQPKEFVEPESIWKGLDKEKKQNKKERRLE